MNAESEGSFRVLEESFVNVEDQNKSLASIPCESPCGTIDKILQYFYENALHTDVSFHVRCGDGYISFSCHKLVLSIWSSVFADIFTKKESLDTVEISEVPPSAFEVMIKYCYDIETELQKYRDDVNFLLKVYKGASEYKIKGLQLLCCEIFSCSLPTKDNVFELLDAAAFIGSESLKHRCYKVIQTQTRQILESRELVDINKTVVNMILEMTTLSLDSEFELISWVFDWAIQESLKCRDVAFRDLVNPFLPRLNFLSLKPEEFGKLVSKHKDFFDEKEGFAIFMNIVCPESWPLPPWLSKSFSRNFLDSEDTASLNN